MKIELKNLLPNPFRMIDKYPINKDKLKTLIASIESTEFWDNILARPSPTDLGRYEIAYGHHRLAALREVHGKKSSFVIDIPIRELSDEQMLKIMANENMEQWGLTTDILVQTIESVERFLIVAGDIKGKRASEDRAELIKKFLGSTYSKGKIQDALAILHATQDVGDHPIDRLAATTITTTQKAAAFVAAIKRSAEPISIAKQREMAQAIQNKEKATDQITEQIKYHGYQPKPKEVPDILKFLSDRRREVDRVAEYCKQLKGHRKELRGVPWLAFKTSCECLMSELEDLLNGKPIPKEIQRRLLTQKES